MYYKISLIDDQDRNKIDIDRLRLEHERADMRLLWKLQKEGEVEIHSRVKMFYTAYLLAFENIGFAIAEIDE